MPDRLHTSAYQVHAMRHKPTIGVQDMPSQVIRTANEEEISIHCALTTPYSIYLIPDCVGLPVGAQLPCTCLPLAIKGRAHALQGTSLLRLTQALCTTTHRGVGVLRSGGLNHSNLLCVLVFIHLIRQTLGCPYS